MPAGDPPPHQYFDANGNVLNFSGWTTNITAPPNTVTFNHGWPSPMNVPQSRQMPIREGEEVLVPTFEVATNPQISLSDLRTRRFNILDRTSIASVQNIAQEEDANIFNALTSSVDVTAAQVVPSYDSVTRQELLRNGWVGDIWNTSLHVTSHPAIVRPEPEQIERMPDAFPGDHSRWDDIV